jgi:hypothetical protein
LARDFDADGVVVHAKSVKDGTGTQGSQFGQFLYVVDFAKFVKYKFMDLLIGCWLKLFEV